MYTIIHIHICIYIYIYIYVLTDNPRRESRGPWTRSERWAHQKTPSTQHSGIPLEGRATNPSTGHMGIWLQVRQVYVQKKQTLICVNQSLPEGWNSMLCVETQCLLVETIVGEMMVSANRLVKGSHGLHIAWTSVARSGWPNCSAGNCCLKLLGRELFCFNKRISSKSSIWEIWARWGIPTVSFPLPEMSRFVNRFVFLCICLVPEKQMKISPSPRWCRKAARGPPYDRLFSTKVCVAILCESDTRCTSFCLGSWMKINIKEQLNLSTNNVVASCSFPVHALLDWLDYSCQNLGSTSCLTLLV